MTASPGLIAFQCLTFAMIATVYSLGLALRARWDDRTRDLRSPRVMIEGFSGFLIGLLLVVVALPSAGQTGWLADLPAIVTLIFVLAGGAFWLHQRIHACRRNARSDAIHCDVCGYDLRGILSTSCPECGGEIRSDRAALRGR